MASAACLAQDIELHASYPTIRRLRAAEKKDPKALGVAYYQAGQHLLFRQQMEQAMAADPRDHMPHYLLGRHFDSDLQDFDRAAAYFLASLERNPKHALSRAHLGHTLEMRGLRAEAVEAYSQATAIQPCLPFAVAGLARLGSATVELMRKTLECGGDDVMLLRALAKAVSDAEAAVYLERALVLDPSNSALAYQVHRSWFAAGDAVKAAAALEVYRKLHDIYGGR
jgi:tetratricopeptide (TPR) repeat protein